MSRLHALIYVSTANHLLSLAELEQILQGAQRRNLEQDVTGVLLYDAGNFMQYLEGPVAGVNHVYEVIKSAPLHHGLVELLRWSLVRREFPHWAMAFRSVQVVGATLSHPIQSPSLLDWLDAQADPDSVVDVLLTNFWRRGQRSLACVVDKSCFDRQIFSNKALMSS